MEDTLGVMQQTCSLSMVSSLNPCSNGRYSRRAQLIEHNTDKVVLILVLMEDTLGEFGTISQVATNRLNPCSNGRYSRRS